MFPTLFAAANSNALLPVVIAFGVLAGLKVVADQWLRDKRRAKRKTYYNEDYLKSDAWKRKRAVVLKRDRYRCVYCGNRATQVHHKKYAPRNIGKEPIEWLMSVCETCHEKQHSDVSL